MEFASVSPLFIIIYVCSVVDTVITIAPSMDCNYQYILPVYGTD